jgi:hypothetical protein
MAARILNIHSTISTLNCKNAAVCVHLQASELKLPKGGSTMSTDFRMEPDGCFETQAQRASAKKSVVKSLTAIGDLTESLRWLGERLDNDSSEDGTKHHPAGLLLQAAVQQLAAEHEFVEFNLRELGFFQSLLEGEDEPAPTLHLIKPPGAADPEGGAA